MSADQPTPAVPNEGTILAVTLADATPQIKKAWLDRLPAGYRHFLIMAISFGLSEAAIKIPTWHLTHTEAGAAGIALTFAVEYLTPLTRQFGVGK